jgi:hypothetical protein
MMITSRMFLSIILVPVNSSVLRISLRYIGNILTIQNKIERVLFQGKKQITNHYLSLVSICVSRTIAVFFSFLLRLYIERFSSSSQPQRAITAAKENAQRHSASHQQQQQQQQPSLSEHETRNTMSESDNREHGVLRRDVKRLSQNAYKPLNTQEILSKTPAEIKQEFRKMPNPPAKDPHAAR